MRAFLAAAVLALAGCASLAPDPLGPPPAQELAPAAAPASAAAPAFDLRVECADERLRALVERHTLLQRYRALTGLEPSEFARLAVLAERDARNLLAAEGYFSPRVSVRRLPAQGSDARPTLAIEIEPGQAATVAQADIGFEGDIATSADAGAQAQRRAIAEGWKLAAGERFTQQRWDEAKTEALRQLVAQRYPRGRISYSVADVDAGAGRVRLTVRLDSGPLIRLGSARVTGAQRYPPELAERLSWLAPGDVYDQQQLVDAQQRLAASGYYDSAWIGVDPSGEAGAATVDYSVAEAKRHKAQLGIGYSTDSGPRLSLEHRDNTALGTSWRSDTQLRLERKQPLLQVELVSLPDAGGWRRAALARTMRQDDGVLGTLSRTLRAGLIKTEEAYDRHFYLQYDHATVTGSGSSAVPDALLGDGAAISANYAWTGRWFDPLRMPSSGHGLSLELGIGMTTVGARKPFARVQGRWLGIVPFSPARGRLQLRSEAGAVLASRDARLPSTDLFRTGGDATVRGFAWRSIGVPVGGGLVGPGRYMAVGSVEWQRPILQERFPGLLEHVLFIDVGGIANRGRGIRAHWGVGTGLRLITPVGPMQLDIAHGFSTKGVRLHLNVGFVF